MDLRPHPTGRRRAGSQPSCPPSQSGGDSPPLERDEGGEVVEVEVERDQEDPVQHCSHLQGRAEPGSPDAGLPGHWPWPSSPLSHDVDGDHQQQPGNQAEMAARQMKEEQWRKKKAWRH